MGTDLRARLTDLLSADAASDSVEAYFAEPGHGMPTFTGRLFERFSPGIEDEQGRFTPADLLAVEALSVTVPVEVAFSLLHGRLGHDVSTLLHAIPTDVQLGDAEARAHVRDGSAAERAWHLLKSQHRVGWVTAGKLLARKRPRLIPVYDDVVRCALGSPEHFWLSLHDALSRSAEIRALTETLRMAAGVPSTVSDLRLIDVVIWMSHRREHRLKHASVGSSVAPS